MDYELIFLAAGQGKRMNTNQNKMWLELASEPIFVHALKPFLADSRCKHVIVVCQADEKHIVQQFLEKMALSASELAQIELVSGGAERQYSVKNGLAKCGAAELVLVHDGARPFVSLDMIDRLCETASCVGAAICAVKVKDTVKRVEQGIVQETVDREKLWQVQTPQAFKQETLKEAHAKAAIDDFLGTDEASLVERLGVPIQVVEGSYYNIKITTPEDMPLAQAILGELEGNEH